MLFLKNNRKDITERRIIMGNETRQKQRCPIKAMSNSIGLPASE
jgi:hypothetical protein